MESWQVFHAARKKLPKGMLQNIYRRSSSLVGQWAADPKYCDTHSRNPLERMKILLEELDTAGAGEYARWAIDFLADGLGGRFATFSDDTKSDKGTVDGEVADLAIAMGALTKAVRDSVEDGELDTDEIAILRQAARDMKSDIDQLMDAVGMPGGV